MSKWGKSGCSDWLSMWLPKLTPAQFAVLFAMSRYADSETGELYASELAFADDTGLAKGYVNDIVDELAAAGPIIVKVPGKQGRGNSAQYALVDDPNALARHVSDVKAKRKARKESSEAAREQYRTKGRADKEAMRASHRSHWPQNSFPRNYSLNSIEHRQGVNDAIATMKRQDEARARVQSVQALSVVLRQSRELIGTGVDDLIRALFASYGHDVSDTLETIKEAANQPNPRAFIAETIESRRP